MAVFVDFRKAFDTVNHQILIAKLFRYGIRGVALSLISSYLKDRRQRVKIGNSFSDELVSNLGVPQGSNLGPYLFLLYVNDMVNVSSIFRPVIFADDTTLIIENSHIAALETHCNLELIKFRNWADANKLSLNLDKTYVMFFSYTKFYDNYNFSICMSGVQLSLERSGMFLGVLLDSELKFSKHINHTCNKKIQKPLEFCFV